MAYNIEPFEVVESFKHLRFPPIVDGMNGAATRHLEVGKRSYYALENTCNGAKVKYIHT